MKLEIAFHGPLMGVGTNCGYGYSAVELINAWNRAGVPVWWGDTGLPVQFSYGQPHFYHDRVEGKLNIGCTPWESTGVPKSWIPKMNSMDEIWATCEANAEWFREAGVNVPIRVMRLGINADHFPLNKRELAPGEPFKFLHIGEPAPRKGGSMVYEAFCDASKTMPNATLTIKGKPRFNVNHPKVTVIEEYISQEELRDLYQTHHAMIYPTNGEGFGFIPFQATATGMPAAVTDWSASTDYMEYCFPIRVERMVMTDYAPHEGMWALPSYDSCVLWMQSFYDAPSYFFSKAFRSGRRLHDSWSWDIVANDALEFMMESLNKLP